MGKMVDFPTDGPVCHGYLATPSGNGPGVVVIQEWWGLVDHIKDVADRFAAEGFVALAPDLYSGKATKEPDEAAKLMMDLKLEKAASDLSGAVKLLGDHDKVQPKKIGCVGFCMGGALSLTLATLAPVDASVTYYGVPAQTEPDYGNLKGPVLGHFAEHDGWASPDAAKALIEKVESKGRSIEIHTYPGTEHAFFNDTRPEVYKPDAAKVSWERTLSFFREHLA